MLTDALTLADWAINVAGIPPHRIVLFGQSLGTAVAISLAHHLAVESATPTLFAGMVLVAPLADVKTLTATSRVAGTIPLLSPIASFPRLLNFLNRFIVSKWPRKYKLNQFVRFCEATDIRRQHEKRPRYHITIIHAEDDYDIPWSHSEELAWHAVNVSKPISISYDDLEIERQQKKRSLGTSGWAMEWRSENGLVRQNVLKYGLHDVIMSYPVVSLAVLRALLSE